MTYTPRGIFAAVLAVSTLAFGAAQAGPVTWDSASNISGNSDVSTNGSLVGAYNFGSATDTTVNGVVFKSLLIGAPQVVSVTMDSVHTLDIVPVRIDTLANFTTGSAILGSSFMALSSAYRALLGSAAGSDFGDLENRLTLGGLTIGQTYEFQAWVNDSSIEGCCSYGIDLDGVDLNPNTATDSIGDVIAGGVGQFVIGTFVADATTQQLTYVRGEVSGGINGFQLRALADQSVPEPGTAALVGLAVLGLGVARRRSKRA